MLYDRNKDLREYFINNFPTLYDHRAIAHNQNPTFMRWWEFNNYRFRLGVYDVIYIDLIEDPDYFIRLELGDLKSKFFSDIYNPTDNELVFFELTYGFEWPFCEKNKKDNRRCT